MYVLDLDLDFFLDNICPLAEKGTRPDANQASPWPEEQVRFFLEHNCGLRRETPVPGALFETHDQALSHWQGLEKPLSVTHVDAHSDLGVGKPGPAFVLESVITRPVEARLDIPGYYAQQKLDEANYLLFALAFRWISELENVRNPASLPDMPSFCGEGFLQLESAVGRLIPALNRHEPKIPYRVYADWRTFRAKAPYAFASLAVSPLCAPGGGRADSHHRGIRGLFRYHHLISSVTRLRRANKIRRRHIPGMGQSLRGFRP